MAKIDEVRLGSEVWVEGLLMGKKRRRHEVMERRTRTQIVLRDGTRFRRADGGQIGGDEAIVDVASVEEIAAFELQEAARKSRESELREEEYQLRKLLPHMESVDMLRAHDRYVLRFGRATAAQVRALVAAYRGAR